MTRMVFAVLLLMMTATVSADVLLIDGVRQADKIEVPTNGLSKSEVQSKFGAPEKRSGSVGKPPITRWDYPDYTVYFEHNLVLSTVLHPGAVIDKS